MSLTCPVMIDICPVIFISPANVRCPVDVQCPVWSSVHARCLVRSLVNAWCLSNVRLLNNVRCPVVIFRCF